MSAALVATALECGCNPAHGIYCDSARFLYAYKERVNDAFDRAVMNGSEDEVIDALEKSADAAKAVELHLAGEW